jgi:hypothetical protein
MAMVALDFMKLGFIIHDALQRIVFVPILIGTTILRLEGCHWYR